MEPLPVLDGSGALRKGLPPAEEAIWGRAGNALLCPKSRFFYLLSGCGPQRLPAAEVNPFGSLPDAGGGAALRLTHAYCKRQGAFWRRTETLFANRLVAFT